jgi:NAD(P)H dehydrogenase (quinone)
MSIVVTGATGHLGGLAVRALLDRGVAADQVIATGRNASKLAELDSLGVGVRRADYTDPASLKQAFVGADTLLFVSSSEVGQRVDQHRNVLAAARDAGVDLVAYTSITRADSSPLLLAAEHRATEQMIVESGLPHVLLRHSWYIENYTAQIPGILERGVIVGAAGDGRISAATRADYAEAAAAVVTTDGHAGTVYELGGDTAFTMTEYAAALSGQSGTPVAYQNLPVEDYAASLTEHGLPAEAAAVYADADAGVARGDLYVDTGDLSRLIGRPTTPLADVIATALARPAGA